MTSTLATERRARKPRSLVEALERDEEGRHAQRMRDIKTMAAQLALLDRFAPALDGAFPAQWGLDWRERFARSIEWHRDERALRFSMIDFTGIGRRLHELFMGQGFKEAARRDHTSFDVVLLTHGRLRVTFHIDKPSAPTAPAAAANGSTS